MATQGIFKRNLTYVVVKRIRLGNDQWIEPGEIVDRTTHRLHRLQSWHRRRMIGEEGRPWTEAMLKLTDQSYAKPELGHGVEEELSEPVKIRAGKWSIEGVDQFFKTKKAALEYLEENT